MNLISLNALLASLTLNSIGCSTGSGSNSSLENAQLATETKYRLFDAPNVIINDIDECYTYTELSFLKATVKSSKAEASLTQKSPKGCPVRRNVQMPLIFKGKLEVNHGEYIFTGKNDVGESIVMVDYTEGTRRGVPRDDNAVVTITSNG